jgi:hypothetical protein
MRLPSFQNVITEFVKTTKRYPLSILVACIGTFFACSTIYNNVSENDIRPKYVLYTLLMLPITIAAHNFYAYYKSDKNKCLIFLIALFIIALGINYDLFFYTQNLEIKIYRYGMWIIACHLIAAIFPFYKANQTTGFWNFNKTMFLRFLTSVFFSLVLFAGLSGAIASLDALFNWHIDSKTYAYLFAFIAGIFNTYMFLGDIPEPLDVLETSAPYPKGLRIFTQYILLSLVTIYLIILYIYIGKIVVLWELPNGWVCNLIIAFAICSILSFLLLYPLRNDEHYDWILWFNRLFYFLLIPLVILAFIAIGRRINDYGLTEERYLVCITALWLGGLALYFILSKQKNISIIPKSLMLICLLCAFGPWGVYQVPIKNQINRFKSVFESNKSIKSGKIIPLTDAKKSKLSKSDIYKLSGSGVYLQDDFRLQFLKKELAVTSNERDLFKSLNIPYDTYLLNTIQYTRNIILQIPTPDNEVEIDISGYKKIRKFYYNMYDNNDINDNIVTKNPELIIPTTMIKQKFPITTSLDIQELKLGENILDITYKSISYKIFIQNINYMVQNDSKDTLIQDISGYLIY